VMLQSVEEEWIADVGAAFLLQYQQVTSHRHRDRPKWSSTERARAKVN
jgi:hypothetical protein